MTDFILLNKVIDLKIHTKLVINLLLKPLFLKFLTFISFYSIYIALPI